ncbi:MAG TPA: acyltransferase family protein [Solirubrobacterales bacterium]|nr:acyltransferase family protein [Solirubrobacterales bacterium]
MANVSTVEAPTRGAEGSAVERESSRSTDSGLKAFPDIAKIAAIVAVVTVHVAIRPNEGFHVLTDLAWLGTTAVETAMRWCVPLFVMVSGMLLVTPRTAEQAPGDFYRRRAARVAVPLIGWTLFARVFNELHAVPASLEEHIQAIYVGAPYYHLYFLFVIAGLYLVTPLLARAISALSERQLAITAISALTLGFLWGGLPPWLPSTGSNAFSQFAPFVGYFLAGCWLVRVQLNRYVVPVSVAVFAVLLAASTVGTYFFVSTHGLELGRYLYGYLSPPVILMSICVFLVLRVLVERREAQGPIRHIRALHFVGEATFGIFLIHPFLFSLWGDLPPDVPTAGSSLALWLPATVAGLLAVSFVCTVVLKQIPYLRRLV